MSLERTSDKVAELALAEIRERPYHDSDISFLLSLIDQITDELEATDMELQLGMSWRPIDTAPKDGTWFLGCNIDPGIAAVSVVHWSIAGGEWMWISEGWVSDGGSYLDLTHWMPLPDPPKE